MIAQFRVNLAQPPIGISNDRHMTGSGAQLFSIQCYNRQSVTMQGVSSYDGGIISHHLIKNMTSITTLAISGGNDYFGAMLPY